MKKYGKFEMMPDGTRAKQPTAKSMLLHTYLTGLLCMVLCITMFFGTTYAWFTSEVTDAGNEISVGILEVGLYKQTKTGDESLAEEDVKLFDGSIRWEPGYTSLETVKIVNEGDLSFKYTLNFTDGELMQGSETLQAVADHFEVWVYDHSENTYEKPASYAVMAAQGSGWKNVGTLAQVLAGKTVLDGEMTAVRQDDEPDDETTPNETEDGVKKIDTYTIALHMKETADVSVMGHKLSLNVKLVAFQKAYEEDSFSNMYDDIYYVTTAKELQNALDTAPDKTIIQIGNDITGNVLATQRSGVSLTIDGNGKNFTGVMTVFGAGNQSGAESLTIRNVHFVAANGAESCIVSPDKTVYNKYSYAHNLTVENCTFTDPDGAVNCAAIRTGDGGDKNWVVTGCTVDNTMHSLLQVQNINDKLTVKNCTVKSKNGINLNSTTNLEMSGCNFDVTGYAVRFGVDKGGNLGTPKSYVLSNNTLKSACNDGDAVIIFRASAVDAVLELINTTLDGTLQIKGHTSATTINRR